jgi:hypothetical protein
MFIYKSEKDMLKQMVSSLSESVLMLQLKVSDLEAIHKENVVVDKRTLQVEAKKILHQREKQKIYSKRYYEKKKVEKQNESVPQSH